MTACSITYSWGRGVECGNTPAISIRGICVHEHIETANACVSHLGGSLYCRDCFDAPGGLSHQCEMTVTHADTGILGAPSLHSQGQL